MNSISNNINEEVSEINIKNIYYLILKNWYWYIISVVICITASKIYLRYTPSVYNVSTSLLIKDDKTRLGGTENFIDGLDLFSNSRNVQNEIEIVRSINNIKDAIKDLDMEVSYFAKGSIRTDELYKQNPFEVRLDTNFRQHKKIPIYIKILSDSTFSLHPYSQDSKVWKDESVYKFGEYCHTQNFSLIVDKTAIFPTAINHNIDYYFVINDIDELSYQYAGKLHINLSDKKSSILLISLNSILPNKDIDFLNKLCEVYIDNGLKEKNQIAVNTIHFIDGQLGQITDSLQGAESKLENFRSKEKIMDISSAATNAYGQLEVLEKDHAELVVKDRYYKYLLDYLTYNYDIEKMIAPSAMGIQDPQLNSLISELHNLKTEKASLSFSAHAANPAINIIDIKIDNAKKSLVETLKNIIKASDIALGNIQSRINRIQSLVNKLPVTERNFINIQRRFLLNENIYNYLMQKRIEAGIAKASNISDNKIVNEAMMEGSLLIAPKRTVILLISFIIGLLIPSAGIYARTILNDTITNVDVLEKYTKVPVIGTIIHYNGEGQLPILTSPKSGVSESIRSLRVNLQYLAVNKKNKIIGITSSVSGEGKTFFSSNLAASIALSGVKTIIIGADLRKPKLHDILSIKNDIGLSNYYINKATVEEIILKSSVQNLDIITSGPIPPNPTELLESTKTDELLKYLQAEYECIIIDAPPVGLVADYYLLSKHMDADLFLVRQDHTNKRLLKNINQLNASHKLRNMFIVFNDVKFNTNYGYYGYQYGYYEEAKRKMKILNKIKSIFKRK